MANISPNQNIPGIESMISSKKTIRTTSIPETRPSMIGSPERVKIQRSLVQNLSKIQRLKIVGCFLKFGGLKYPQTATTIFWGQNNIKNEFTAPSKYSMCKFSAKSDNF